MRMIGELLRDEDGGSLVEYALIVALLVLGAIGIIAALGSNANSVLSQASGSLAG